MLMSILWPTPTGFGRMLSCGSVVTVKSGFAPDGNGPATGCWAAICAWTGVASNGMAQAIRRTKVITVAAILSFDKCVLPSPLGLFCEAWKRLRKSDVCVHGI